MKPVVSKETELPGKIAGSEEFPESLNWIEEADFRLILPVKVGNPSKIC